MVRCQRSATMVNSESAAGEYWQSDRVPVGSVARCGSGISETGFPSSRPRLPE